MTPSDTSRPYPAPLLETNIAGRGDCEVSSVDGSVASPGALAPASDKHPQQPSGPKSHENLDEDTKVDAASPRADSDSPSNSESTSPPHSASQQQQAGQYSSLDSQTRVYNSWSKEESAKLIELVQQYGTNRKWSLIAKHLPGRTGKQCRDRWNNHLRPGLKQGSWTPEEDYVVAYWHSCRGGSWAAIAFWLPGRTAVAIKNHWNAVSKLPDQGNKGTVLVTYTALLRAGLSREDAFDQAVAKVGMPRVRTAVLEQTLAAARVPPNTVVHPPRWDDILTGPPLAPRQPPLSASAEYHHHQHHHLPHHDPDLTSTLARLRPLASHPPPHPLHDLAHASSSNYHHLRTASLPSARHPSLSLTPQYPSTYPSTYQPLLAPKPPSAHPSHSPHDPLPAAAHSLSTASFLDPQDLAPVPSDPAAPRPLPPLNAPRTTHAAIGSPDSICSVPSITEPHLAPLDPPSSPTAASLRHPHDPPTSFLHRPHRHPTAPDPHSPYRRSKPLSPFQLPSQVLPPEMPPSLLDPLAPPSLQHPPPQLRESLHLARQQAAYQILLSRHAGRMDPHTPTSDPRHQHPQPHLPRASSLSAMPPHAPSPHHQLAPQVSQQLPALPSTDSQIPSTSSQHLLPASDPHPMWAPPTALTPRHPDPTAQPSLLQHPPASHPLPPLFSDPLPPSTANPPANPSQALADLEAEAALLEWAMARAPADPASTARSSSAVAAAAAAAAAADLEAAAAWASAGPQWRQHTLGGAAGAPSAALGELMEADARLEALLKREREELLDYSAATLPLRDASGYGMLGMRDMHGAMPVSGYLGGGGGYAAAGGSGWPGVGSKRDAPEGDSAMHHYGAEGQPLGDTSWRARVGCDTMRNKLMRLGYPPHEGGSGGGGPPGAGQQ